MQFVPQGALDGDSKAGAGIAGEPRQVKVCMCVCVRVCMMRQKGVTA